MRCVTLSLFHSPSDVYDLIWDWKGTCFECRLTIDGTRLLEWQQFYRLKFESTSLLRQNIVYNRATNQYAPIYLPVIWFEWWGWLRRKLFRAPIRCTWTILSNKLSLWLAISHYLTWLLFEHLKESESIGFESAVGSPAAASRIQLQP